MNEQNEPASFAWESEAEEEEETWEEAEEDGDETEGGAGGEVKAEVEAPVSKHEEEAPRGDLDERAARSYDDAARVEAGDAGAEMAAAGTEEATEAWGEVVEGPLNMPLEAFRPGWREAGAGNAGAAAGAATLLRNDVADDLLRQRHRSVVLLIVGGAAAILLAAWAVLSGDSVTKGYAYAKGLSQEGDADETSHDVQRSAGLNMRPRLRRAPPRPATADSAAVEVDADAHVASALDDEQGAGRRRGEAANPVKVGHRGESIPRGGTHACSLGIEWAQAAGPARLIKASELD